jgi:hypothetical protein
VLGVLGSRAKQKLPLDRNVRSSLAVTNDPMESQRRSASMNVHPECIQHVIVILPPFLFSLALCSPEPDEPAAVGTRSSQRGALSISLGMLLGHHQPPPPPLIG